MVPENNGIVRLSSNEVGINSIIIADKAPTIIIILVRFRSIINPIIFSDKRGQKNQTLIILFITIIATFIFYLLSNNQNIKKAISDLEKEFSLIETVIVEWSTPLLGIVNLCEESCVLAVYWKVNGSPSINETFSIVTTELSLFAVVEYDLSVTKLKLPPKLCLKE